MLLQEWPGKEKGRFVNDKRDGEYIAYYKNGRTREKATFRNGKPEGKFLSFDIDDPANRDNSQEEEPTTFADEDNLREKEKMVDDLFRNLANFEKEQKGK